MEEFGEIFETYIEAEDVTSDIMDVKETAKLNSIISRLRLYSSNIEELTKVYTGILMDDNVAFILKNVSQDPIFLAHFPEFYEKNEYGENVINCQQNNSFHKYGVFRHILSTIEFVGNPQIPIGDWQKKILKWTMLLHDIGKPYVKTIAEDGTESFGGHDDKSVELSVDILNRFYFTEEEKHIILTLIKYHDRFLNEGEITVDNMKFLAAELDNNKELFYLLIDVKEADSKSKSLEVYNKFKILKNKYLEFINNYFIHQQEKDIAFGEGGNTSEIDIKDTKTESVTVSELEALLDSVLTRRSIKSMYQPVIDLVAETVDGYEVFTRIECHKKIDILNFFNYARDVKKYDKLQQVLLINGIEDFESLNIKESNRLFVNADFDSYDKYINKPRLYDMMSKNKIVIEFQNYEKKDFNKFKETIDMIHKNGGFVALDKFGVGNLTIDDINLLHVDYIVPDMPLIQDLVNDVQKQRYISELVTYSISSDTKVVILGVEDIQTLEVLKRLGVRYVQGYFFAKPTENVTTINDKIRDKLSELNQETIS